MTTEKIQDARHGFNIGPCNRFKLITTLLAQILNLNPIALQTAEVWPFQQNSRWPL